MFALMEVLVAAAPTIVVSLGSFVYNISISRDPPSPGIWTLVPLGSISIDLPTSLCNILYKAQ